MSHAAALPKFSLLASLSPILSGVPILPRRHVRTDYTPVNDCSVWEFQTSFALSGTVGDFKKSPNNLWWSLMYSYAHHLKIKVLLTHIITGMTGWHMPFLLCVSHLPHLYTMTGMGDSVFWLPHPPPPRQIHTAQHTLCSYGSLWKIKGLVVGRNWERTGPAAGLFVCFCRYMSCYLITCARNCCYYGADSCVSL